MAKGQRRAALIVRALENMTSKERLKKSGAFNLGKPVWWRRERVVMISQYIKAVVMEG